MQPYARTYSPQWHNIGEYVTFTMMGEQRLGTNKAHCSGEKVETKVVRCNSPAMSRAEYTPYREVMHVLALTTSESA